MDLLQTIRERAASDAAVGNWSAVAAAVQAVELVRPNSRPWTIGDVQAALGDEVAAGMAAAIRAAARSELPSAALFESAFVALSTTGVRLDTDSRQAMIEAVGSSLPAEAVAAIKALGRVVERPFAAVSAAECERLWNADQLDRRIVNAVALARERLSGGDSSEVQAQKWAQAWIDGV